MKIPQQAKRVFKGVVFDVYQWEQDMFDGSKEIFEALKRTNGVTIIAVSGDKIIYAEEDQPGTGTFTTFFGGKSEEGEDPLETAKRELLEESGLSSDDWELVKIHDSYSSKLDWTVHTYVARNVVQTGTQHLDPGEKITVKEASWDEFLTIAAGDSFRNKEWALELLRWQKNAPEKLDAFKQTLFQK